MRLLLTIAAVLVLAACTSGTDGSPAPSSSAPQSSGSSDAGPPTHGYYLSLGDSYAAGYQPATEGNSGGTSTVGFPYQVARESKAKGYDYTLVNLACSGATTGSMLTAAGCDRSLLGPGAPAYSSTQVDAARQFLGEHRGHVGLITISIGGNDFLRCGTSPTPITCASAAVRSIATNLRSILARLRSAAGPDVRIVGTTYPDVLLAGLLDGNSTQQNVAQLSVTAFRSLFNPQLRRTYAAAGAGFVDVTEATGGYGPLTAMTTLAPYGRIPVPVAAICRYTWFCQAHDIHPTPTGHALIAKLVVARLPSH